MNSMRKPDDASKTLSKIGLAPGKRVELWDVIERRIDAEPPTDAQQETRTTFRRRSMWGQVGAAVAAVAILAASLPTVIHQGSSSELNNTTSLVNPSGRPNLDNPSNGAAHRITVDAITQYYANNHRQILAMTSYPAYHAEIVESNLDPTVANDFDWWDMDTGKVEFLAGRPFYMSIDQVVSENEVLFLATGGNSESPFVDFPYYIDAKRADANSPFADANLQAAYFPIEKSIAFGDGKVEVLSQLSVTSNGVTMGYSPIKGQEGSFAADSTGAPKTTISSIPGKNELLINLKNTTLHVNQTQLQGMKNVFVESVAAQTSGSDVQVILKLSKQAKFYTGSIDRQFSMPTMHLGFANEAPIKLVDSGTSEQTNPLFNTILTLPDGRTVTPNPNLVARWQDVIVSLRVTSLPPAYAGADGYIEIVGNHAVILSHENVSTPAGQALLVHFQRTAPAAAQSNVATDEYCVIFYGSEYAYVLDADVNGNPRMAKSELMQLLNQWEVPNG